MMQYGGQHRISARLQGRAEVWRIALGSVLIAAIYFALLGMFLVVFGLGIGPERSLALAEGMAGNASPLFTLMALYSFVGMLLAVLIVGRALHRAGIVALAGPYQTLIRDFFRVGRALLALYGGLLVLAYFFGPDQPRPVANMGLTTWVKYLPLALGGILIQTFAEELAFRGYLQGHLAARFKSPLVWMGLPAILFALGHYSPAEYGAVAWVIVLWTALFGLAAADLTARTGSVGAALGFHFMNNAMAMLVVSLKGPFSGLALFVYPFSAERTDMVMPLLLVDLGVLLVSWLTCRLACRV